MRHQRFYTLVGLFVIVAFGLLLFGAGFFYEEYKRAQIQTFVMFFKGSLKGLGPNAPVTYRGIKIGEVKQIELTENKMKTRVKIPVYVQFFVEKNLGFSQDPIHLLINQGYVGNVTTPNMLTGLSEVELIREPSISYNSQTSYNGYPIFPTGKPLERYPTFEETLKTARQALNDISVFFHSKEVQDTLQEMRNTLNATRMMSNSINLFALDATKQLPTFILYFNHSLKQMDDAAYSIQNLTDYLLRHPESLLGGKQ